MPFLPPPPSRLFLMRHAQSGWAAPGQSDFERTLDPQGREEAARVASLAAAAGYRPELLLVSTAKRCRETAEFFLKAFEDAPDVVLLDSLYNAPPSAYYDAISQHAARSSLMLLGHNPAMEEMLEALAGMRATADVVPDGYPTAGFAVLTHAGPPLAELGWDLTAFLRR